MMRDQSPADIGMMREIEERLRARLISVERETESLRSRARFFGFALTVTLALLACPEDGASHLTFFWRHR